MLSNRGAAKIVIGILLLLALIAGAIIAFIFWTEPSSLTVSGHSWKREIVIEDFRPRRKDDENCSFIPTGAYDVVSYQKHRGMRNGQPEYETRCRYVIDSWERARSVTKTGGLLDPPIWPEVGQLRNSGYYGTERVGPATETFYLHFVDEGGKQRSCGLPANQWRAVPDGGRYTAELGVLSDHLDCRTLKPH